MKIILLCLILSVSGMAGAQIVNIPDANFKQVLLEASPETFTAKDDDGNYITIDVNSDGEIQVSEALTVYELNVSASSLSDATGVQSFENLGVLSINKTNLVTLDVSGMENLEVLNVAVNQLMELTLAGCTSLTELDCMVNQLQDLDLTGLAALSKLTALQNQISAIDVSGVDLTVLWLAENPIVELDVSTQTNLVFLLLADCPELTSVNLKNGVTDPVNGDSFWNCTSLMHMCADEEEIALIYDEIDGTPGISDDIVVTANCDTTAAMEGHELDNTVKMYPNPVKDNLNITAGHDLKSIELYDLQGRLLQTVLVKGTDATLDLNGRAEGVYFVKVMTEKGVKVEKIINE